MPTEGCEWRLVNSGVRICGCIAGEAICSNERNSSTLFRVKIAFMAPFYYRLKYVARLTFMFGTASLFLCGSFLQLLPMKA